MVAHRKDLIAHQNTKKHIGFASQTKEVHVPLTNFLKPSLTKERKIAELKIAAFIAEHCSISSIDHLGCLIKQLSKQSETLQNIQLHRTKCTALIKNVLAPAFFQKLIEDLADNYYSLIIDESTSVDNRKLLCVMIKYFSLEKASVMTVLYRVVQVESGTAEVITKSIVNMLETDGINIQRLLGIGVDGANVMVGKYNSLSSRLQEIVPHLITVKCVCHSLHLACENSMKKLPSEVEYIIRETNMWFCHSAKRQIEYSKIYILLAGKNPLKIDKLSGTRWLARYGAIENILEQWDALELHFKLASTQEKCRTASTLSKLFNNDNKLYFIFLKDILNPVKKLNKLFQSEQLNTLQLYNDLKECFLILLQKIVHPGILANESKEKITDFDFNNYMMPTECLTFSYNFTHLASSMQIEDIMLIKENCKTFTLEICSQIKKRLPDNIDLMEKLSLFSIENAQKAKKPDITSIVVHFKNICEDIDATLSEWNNLHFISWSNTTSLEKFWYEVGQKRDAGNNPKFCRISKLGLSLLLLPYSNASVERAFSMFNVVKNKLRNRMNISTVESILRVKYSLNNKCQDFIPTPEMLKLFNSNDMYTASEEDFATLEIFEET